MEAYTAFAKVYDKFMTDVPYEKWADFIDFLIREVGISKPNRGAADPLESERNLVLDIGCGTGVLTEMMYDKGYDLIGVDLSQEMLDVAVSSRNGRDILYICQDMSELDLYSTVGTVYSTCDSINYLIDDDQIENCFRKVANYLYPGGLFIFDVNTVHKYRDVIGEKTIAETGEDSSFIWDNYYNELEKINEYDLTLFIKENGTNLYKKEVETHFQRGFEATDIMDFVARSGLELLAMVDEAVVDTEGVCSKIVDDINRGYASTMGVNPDTERIIVIARKR